MTSIHGGHRGRLKEALLARPDALHDHQILEALLFYSIPQKDTNDLAHELLDRFGSISGVLDALPAELRKVPGVGEHTIALLKTVKEVSARYFASRTSMDHLMDTARIAARELRPHFVGAREEKVYVMCLDGKNKNLGVRQISEGGAASADVTARKVAEAALSLNAVQIILAHNHTSGIALPSNADKATTRYLAKVLRAVGVELRDHLIFVDDDMVSMRESGFQFYET